MILFACQEVSYDKSRLFCSPNVDEDLASSLSIICGSPLTTNLGKYLSPLPHFFAAHFTAFSASGRALSPIIYLSVGLRGPFLWAAIYLLSKFLMRGSRHNTFQVCRDVRRSIAKNGPL